ncbi:branched-chain amino acid ABC transporter permease [Angustibacter luteus]|uniref:Branched-chain amino acid ABC transporter permease n=1 Tax=Angustibacter luteus TaxID=658456 RepID=A0ABW1JJ22_9ACTN
MERFLFLTVDGVTNGAVLAAFAAALVIIWRATRTVNFAQGAMAVLTTYVAYAVTQASGSYWLGFAAALVAGALLGAAVERGLMRFVPADNHLAAVIVALGLVTILQALMSAVFGNEYRPMQVPFSRAAGHAARLTLPSPYDVFTFVAVALMLASLAWLLGRTALGLRLRASAFAPDVARLLGVRVSRMLTVGWMLASSAGALAAVLVVPTGLGLNPSAMDLVFVSAFAAAVIGGLDSLVGSLVGGLVVGLVLSYATGYVSSDATPLVVLALLLVVLLVRPSGLFAPTAVRQV